MRRVAIRAFAAAQQPPTGDLRPSKLSIQPQQDHYLARLYLGRTTLLTNRLDWTAQESLAKELGLDMLRSTQPG